MKIYRNKKITAIDGLFVLLILIGIMLSIITLFIKKTNLSIFISGVGILILYISFYTLYKLIEKTVGKKEILINSLITLIISLTVVYGGNVLSFFDIVEEFKMSWGYNAPKKVPLGKEVLESDKGYIEKVNQIQGVRKDIRIIGVKTETLEKFQGTWPIDEKVYANIIRAFRNSDNLLVFDLFYLGYKKSGKEALIDALKQNTKVIFSYPLEETVTTEISKLSMQLRQDKLKRFQLKNVIDTDDKGMELKRLTFPPIEQITELSKGIGFGNVAGIRKNKNMNVSTSKMILVAKLKEPSIKKESVYFPSIDLIAICNYFGIDVIKDTEVVIGSYIKIINIPKKEINGKDIMAKPNALREIIIPIHYCPKKKSEKSKLLNSTIAI